MEEILRRLPAQARVLDLACANGSFNYAAFPCLQIAGVDRSYQRPSFPYIQADAAALPFATSGIDAIIANHCLEHFENLDVVLAEAKRVLRPNGALYVSVPDAASPTDVLYRWLNPGDHVQRFTDPALLARRIEQATGLRHQATRELYSSLSFLNARNRTAPAPRKLWLLANGNERALRLLLRLLYKLGPRYSRYGWALWFGDTGPIDEQPRPNVCVHCGAAFVEGELVVANSTFGCPRCATLNEYRAP